MRLTFCERLNEVFGELTNMQVSKKTGLSRRAINRWRNGEHMPRLIELARICKAFNVSADWLLGLTDRRK